MGWNVSACDFKTTNLKETEGDVRAVKVPMSTQRGLSLSWLEDLLLQLAAHHPVPPGAAASRCRHTARQ